MELVNEVIKIKNPGDSDAELKYSIINARILGDSNNNYIIDESTTSSYVEDLLAHEFPFNININLSKNYVLSKGEESVFEVSISWPLDSGTDIIDSEWGNKAYNFQTNEAEKKRTNSNYQIKPSIQIKISLTAEQSLENAKSSDSRYNLSDEILVDVVNNKRCTVISPTCIKMYVLDTNNTLGDANVTLLPNPLREYVSSTYYDYSDTFNSLTETWNVPTRSLLVDDLLKVVSRDVTNSIVRAPGISDALIGNLSYSERVTKKLNKVKSSNGKFMFDNHQFPYLISTDCYWTQSDYNYENAFALRKENENQTEIYNQPKNNTCKVLPIVIMDKNNLK